MGNSADREIARFREQLPRYVAGIMSPAEVDEFEAWVIEHPEFAAEIETERQLRKGFFLADRAGLLDAPPQRATWRQWLPTVSAAAMVAVVTLAIVVQLRGGEPNARAEVSSALTDHLQSPQGIRIVTLARTRGTSGTPDIRVTVADLPDHLVLQPNVVALTCPDGSFELQCADGAAPATPQYAEYDLEIVQRNNGAAAYRSRPVTIGADTMLAFVMHPRNLEVGDYDLLVRGRSETHEEVVGRFWLQINANH